jgi:hypothetical protein
MERDMGIAAKDLLICKTFTWTRPDFIVELKHDREILMTGIFDLLSHPNNWKEKIRSVPILTQ